MTKSARRTQEWGWRYYELDAAHEAMVTAPGHSMAKVFGVTPIELRPGVSGEAFERLWLEEYAPLGKRLGWIGHVAKADRGERAGKYVVIWEITSVEARDRYSSAQDKLTDEALALWVPDFNRLSQKLDTYVEGWPSSDYVVIDKK